jgi:type IV secretion system protein VirB10
MIGDPYEEADHQRRAEEAKVLVPQPAPKNRRVVVAGFVLAGVVLGIVILANVAALVSNRVTPDARPLPKPTTMTRQQSDSFAQQQSGEAAYFKGIDRDRQQQSAEDTVLGQGKDLAGDAYDEVDGVPKKTKAQDDGEHGRSHGTGSKSEADQQRERAAVERQHRRQNDLESSPVALDFSEYFQKERESAAARKPGTAAVTNAGEASAPVAPALSEQGNHHLAFADVPAEEEERPAETGSVSHSKQVHNPGDDYVFDSSFGKLYRLMEDTILETVLVNRLTGASVGPVITMVATDVYSVNGSHLLIPRGTRLLGSVSAVGSTNQERLFVAFRRMIMPDGYSVSLDKFQGLDVVGQTGLRDLVNHHYVQIFGISLALAAIGAAAQVGNSGAYGTYDWGVSMRSGVSQGLSESAQRVMERFLNVLPTFTIRERARVKVMLAGDLLLPDTKNHTMDPDL